MLALLVQEDGDSLLMKIFKKMINNYNYLVREYYKGKQHCTIDLLFGWFKVVKGLISDIQHNAKCYYTEWHFGEHYYAECHYDVCHNADYGAQWPVL
jgi:hypothetical protein